MGKSVNNKKDLRDKIEKIGNFVSNELHKIDEENLDEEVDLNHEASDDSDSGDNDSPWVSYIESQS